jgi:hypothetical protein
MNRSFLAEANKFICLSELVKPLLEIGWKDVRGSYTPSSLFLSTADDGWSDGATKEGIVVAYFRSSPRRKHL